MDKDLREFARAGDGTQVPEAIARVVRFFHKPYGPAILGAIVYLVILAMVALSPSAPSHFIYTDF